MPQKTRLHEARNKLDLPNLQVLDPVLDLLANMDLSASTFEEIESPEVTHERI